jgi:hypothetical protein
MANVSTTITFVSSVTGGDGSISVELDEVMNNGKTQFPYGTKAYFKVYRTPESMNLSLYSTDGSIMSEGSGSDSITNEDLTFIKETTANTRYPVKSLGSYQWLGNNLGSLALQAVGSNIVTLPGKVNDKGVFLGIARLNYTTNFLRYSISIGQRDFEEYPVIVYIEGKIT